MPSEAVACSDGLNGLVTVVYGQIECIYIRTTGAGLAVVIGIGTRGGIDRAVPRIAVTSGEIGRESVSECVLDIECYRSVTA